MGSASVDEKSSHSPGEVRAEVPADHQRCHKPENQTKDLELHSCNLWLRHGSGHSMEWRHTDITEKHREDSVGYQLPGNIREEAPGQKDLPRADRLSSDLRSSTDRKTAKENQKEMFQRFALLIISESIEFEFGFWFWSITFLSSFFFSLILARPTPTRPPPGERKIFQFLLDCTYHWAGLLKSLKLLKKVMVLKKNVKK